MLGKISQADRDLCPWTDSRPLKQRTTLGQLPPGVTEVINGAYIEITNPVLYTVCTEKQFTTRWQIFQL